MAINDNSIFSQNPELATPEADVRIEVIKALLNKSNLDESLIKEIANNMLYFSERTGANIFHIDNVAFSNYFDIDER